ncbi:MAG: repeat protein [Thermoleophilia bacterium]|nr:repeat protein [Thermoleophilia bacterium]
MKALFVSRTALNGIAEPKVVTNAAKAAGVAFEKTAGNELVTWSKARSILVAADSSIGTAAVKRAAAEQQLTDRFGAPGSTAMLDVQEAAKQLGVDYKIILQRIKKQDLPTLFVKSNGGFDPVVPEGKLGPVTAKAGAAATKSDGTITITGKHLAIFGIPTVVIGGGAIAWNVLNQAGSDAADRDKRPVNKGAVGDITSSKKADEAGPAAADMRRGDVVDDVSDEDHSGQLGQARKYLASLAPDSPDLKRAETAVRALEAATTPKADPAKYVAATTGATPAPDREWSGDFAAWALQPAAAIGYANKGAESIPLLLEWAGHAGAAVAKSDREPAPGDILVLDQFLGDAADSFAVVVDYDEDTRMMLTVEGNSKLSKTSNATGVTQQIRSIDDSTVLSIIDPFAAKRIDGPPPPPRRADEPAPGFRGNTTLTIKEGLGDLKNGSPMDDLQPRNERIDNIGRVIALGIRRNESPKVVTAAIATVIVEDRGNNNPAMRDGTSVGMFQQIDSKAWGTKAQRMDIEHAAGKFYDEAKRIENRYSTAGALAQGVQRSAHPTRYSEYEHEAAAWLAAFKG